MLVTTLGLDGRIIVVVFVGSAINSSEALILMSNA